MEKEQNQNLKKSNNEEIEKEQNQNPKKSNNKEMDKGKVAANDISEESKIDGEKLEEKTPDEKILELEDKLARTFAEMENQRRRFEKEKDEASSFSFSNLLL